MASGNISSNIGTGGSGGGAALQSFGEWQNRPSSPKDGERALFDPQTGGSFLLEYRSAISSWFCVSTNGDYADLPITKNGAVNTDLFSPSKTTCPTSVSSGTVTFNHDQSDTDQRYIAECGFLVRKGIVQSVCSLNDGPIPSASTTPAVGTYLGPGIDDTTLRLEGKLDGYESDYHLTVHERGTGGGFVANHASQVGVSGSGKHKASAEVGGLVLLDRLQADVKTESSSGSTSESQNVYDNSPNENIPLHMFSVTESDASLTADLDLHAIRLKV